MKTIFSIALVAIFSLGTVAQTYLTQVKPKDSKTWGYADQTGELVIPAIYRKCFKFSEGMAVIYDNKDILFIKSNGDLVTPEIKGFDVAKASLFGIQGFTDGLLQVLVKKKWGYLDMDGKLAIENKYDKATRFNNGLAVAKMGKDYFIINTSGEETKINIEKVKEIKRFSEGLAPIYMEDGKVGFINTDGEIAIEAKFVSVGYFSNGLAWAKNADKKLGYLNKKGEWAIETKFVAGKDFDKESGLARVKYNDKWAYVSTNGEVVYINNTDIWGDFYNGLAKGRINGKLGFYNNKGEYVIEPQFEGVRNFRNGFAAAKKSGFWGMINAKGEWVIQPEYVGIKDMSLIP